MRVLFEGLVSLSTLGYGPLMPHKPLIHFDYAIKYLLKDKGNYDIVEGFISALLGADGYGPVKIKALLDTESNKESSYLKKSIADLVVEDTEGRIYIVEIERSYTENVLYKAFFNISRLVADSMPAGIDYTAIRKIFHVSLLYSRPACMDHPLAHGKVVFKTMHVKDPGELIIDSHQDNVLGFNILPEYFLISVPLFDDVIKEEIDEWLYVIKNSETKEDFKSPCMKKVAERLNILKMDAGERASYHYYMKDEMSRAESLKAAAAEGEIRGEIRGEIKGEIKGRLAIARVMLSKGQSIDTIMEFTQLTREAIQNLEK